MYRKLISGLAGWKKNSHRKPMIIIGEKQVGKTWIMKEFGRKYYDGYLYINLKENERIKHAMSLCASAEELIEILESETGRSIQPENELIIFDEVQKFPEMVKLLEAVNENTPQYHMLAAGSLSGTDLPAGVDFCRLYPLDFEEFLYACGESRLAELLHVKDRDMAGVFRNKYTFFLKYYYTVGGMPETVLEFCRNRDWKNVKSARQTVPSSFQKDFSVLYEDMVIPVEISLKQYII